MQKDDSRSSGVVQGITSQAPPGSFILQLQQQFSNILVSEALRPFRITEGSKELW